MAATSAAAPHLTSAARGDWLRQLDVELANLRGALAWTTTEGDPRIGLRLAGALAWFWVHHGYIGEGTHWTELLLARPAAPNDAEARASTLYAAAALAWKREDYPVARRYAEESVATRRALGDQRLAFSLSGAGLIATSQGDFERASQFHEESLSLFKAQDDRWGVAYALSSLGDTLLQKGDQIAAQRYYSESLELFTSLGDLWGRGVVLHTLGNVAWAQGDLATARDCYASSVSLLKSIGKNDDIARGLIGLAAATLAEGDADEARRLLAEGLAIWLDFGSKAGAAVCLAGLAGVHASRGRLQEAARLFGAAEAQGQGQPAPYVVDADMFSRYREETRRLLGEVSFGEALAEGQSMSMEEAIDYALREDGER